MREIVPFYQEPRKPANLLEALSFGAEIETGVIDFDRYTGRVSEVKEDGEVKGTVIFLPFFDADGLFDEVLETPTPESETGEEEDGPAQTAILHLANGKEVRLAFKSSPWGVIVQAVDGEGERLRCGSLIEFQPDGTVRRISGVNSSLGFQQNADETIKEAF